MKLFTKYSRINVLVTIGIFLIASLAFYFTLNYVQLQQIDDDLDIEEEEIMLYEKKFGRLPDVISVDDQQIHFTPVDAPFKQRYYNRTYIKNHSGHNEDVRQLMFGIETGGKWYKITVTKSLEQTDKLIGTMLWITSITIMLILVGSFLINRIVLKRLWKPFYSSLALVKDFKVGKDHQLKLPAARIDEFEFMNQTLERITSQARSDYLSLKTFSENASHEIQTPISIIRSKLDLLIQDEELTEHQSRTLQSIYDAIQRLTRLNHSLLLLAKIENRQFEDVQKIDMKKRVQDKMTDFQELWQSHGLIVNASLGEVFVKMNEELADLLLNNLLSNATMHNFKGGRITIDLNQDHLLVSNTSNHVVLDKEKMFQRFYKPNQTKEQNGLGLSIIRQISDASGFVVKYALASDMHNFMIGWNASITFSNLEEGLT